MNVETAIRTSIEYERRVRDTYRTAVTQSADPVARKVFGALADEEQGHVEYLESRLAEWQKTGRITLERLETAVPRRDAVEAGVRRLHQKLGAAQPGPELEHLKRAQQVEIETSDFYRSLVAELPPDVRPLFERFLEIEDGHQMIVQSEIDAVSGLGYCFDYREFELEGG